MKNIFLLCVGVVSIISLLGCQSNVDDDSMEVTAPQKSSQELLWEQSLDGCKLQEDENCEELVYREMYNSGRAEAGDYLVALYRRRGHLEAAYAMTAEIAENDPGRAGLMLIWNGDTVQGYDSDMAIAFYEQAIAEHGNETFDSTDPLAILALRQLSSLYRLKGENLLAGLAYRRMIDFYSDKGQVVDALLEALLLEATGDGPGDLSYSGTCTSPNSRCVVTDGVPMCGQPSPVCIIHDGVLEQVYEIPEGFSLLSPDQAYDYFYFQLSEEDQAILDSFVE